MTADLAHAADEFERSTNALLEAARQVTPDLLDRHPEGGWSARQILHHVADSETHSYLRLRRLLAEPAGSLIQGFDEGAWAQTEALGYRDGDPAHSLAVFIAVRAASLDVLRRLCPDDLERHGTHSATGRYTLEQWIDIYTRHPREHADQLREATRA